MSIAPTLSMIVGGSLLPAGLFGQPTTSEVPRDSALAATTLASSFTDGNAQANLETTSESLAESKLNLEHAKAFTLQTEAGYTMLHIPFEASEGVLPEPVVSVYFDSNSEVVSVGETVLTELSADSGTVQFWQDGTKTMDRLVAEPRSVLPGATAEAAGFSGGTFNDCRASDGIESRAITAIGCIICATATAGIAGTTIGTCAGKAML